VSVLVEASQNEFSSDDAFNGDSVFLRQSFDELWRCKEEFHSVAGAQALAACVNWFMDSG